MDYLNKFLGSISALAGILLFILGFIFHIIIDDNFLNSSNRKYGIANEIGMEEQELEKVVASIMNYVEGTSKNLQVEVEIQGKHRNFFSNRELEHYEDVRKLIPFFHQMLWVFFAIMLVGEVFLGIQKKWNYMIKGVWKAWFCMVFFAIIVAGIAVYDVDILIYAFHEHFFENELWILNPAKDYSVKMFCDGMYRDVLKTVALILLSIAAFTNILALWLYKKFVRKK